MENSFQRNFPSNFILINGYFYFYAVGTYETKQNKHGVTIPSAWIMV